MYCLQDEDCQDDEYDKVTNQVMKFKVGSVAAHCIEHCRSSRS